MVIGLREFNLSSERKLGLFLKILTIKYTIGTLKMQWVNQDLYILYLWQFSPPLSISGKIMVTTTASYSMGKKSAYSVHMCPKSKVKFTLVYVQLSYVRADYRTSCSLCREPNPQFIITNLRKSFLLCVVLSKEKEYRKLFKEFILLAFLLTVYGLTEICFKNHAQKFLSVSRN